jgi:outer membrane protein
MKQTQSIAIGILGVAVIALFILHFTGGSKKSSDNPAKMNASGAVLSDKAGRIAYFEMDSIERNYEYIKEIQGKLKSREQAITNELQSVRNGYMARIQQLQQKAPSMSQTEGEAAQAEINQMERNAQQKEAKLGQDLQEQQFKMMQDINKKIEEYLTDFNKENKFTYIISRQSGDFIYFRDTTMNITNDLIKGLNEQYNKDKSSKSSKKEEE